MEAAKKIFTRAHIIWFLLLNFGLVLLAAGIHFFKSPNNFAMGGTSGISIIAATLLPHMDVGTFMFIINGVLIVLGLVFLGRAVIGATLYSSVALSFYVWVLERAVPMARPFTDDTFLELCYAVILPAAGSAIIFNIGASSGGTDIIAMILSKYTSLEIGKALLVSDFCIALFAGGLYGVRTGLYCVLGLLAKAFVVDNGYDPQFGARPLRRFLQNQVETLIGRKIIADDVLPGATLTVDVENGRLTVK